MVDRNCIPYDMKSNVTSAVLRANVYSRVDYDIPKVHGRGERRDVLGADDAAAAQREQYLPYFERLSCPFPYRYRRWIISGTRTSNSAETPASLPQNTWT